MDAYRLKRNKRMKEEFANMYHKKKLRIGHILHLLAEKYGIKPQTILHIIKGYGIYK